MAVREFTDSDGREWRAWDIRPEAIHPQTKAEDYLADCYIVGWIVFETTSGEEKRRLCPYPIRWAESSEAELRELLERAELVPPHKLDVERQAAGELAPGRQAPAEKAGAEEKLDVTDLDVVRTFRYPGGRIWTVCVVSNPGRGKQPVLRFTAGLRSLDIKTWPKDWPDLPDEQLAQLLRVGAPRRRVSTPGANTPRRRWNDPPGTPPS